jgi:hypothetical protein
VSNSAPSRHSARLSGEKGVELSARVRLVEAHPPRELARATVPGGLERRLDRRGEPRVEVGEFPFAGEHE